MSDQWCCSLSMSLKCILRIYPVKNKNVWVWVRVHVCGTLLMKLVLDILNNSDIIPINGSTVSAKCIFQVYPVKNKNVCVVVVVAQITEYQS